MDALQSLVIFTLCLLKYLLGNTYNFVKMFIRNSQRLFFHFVTFWLVRFFWDNCRVCTFKLVKFMSQTYQLLDRTRLRHTDTKLSWQQANLSPLLLRGQLNVSKAAHVMPRDHPMALKEL